MFIGLMSVAETLFDEKSQRRKRTAFAGTEVSRDKNKNKD
jgi:hypothetical protein